MGQIFYKGKEYGCGNSNNKSTYNGPIGEVISFMGSIAPSNFLICDGAVYNILDYYELANHIKTNFGSYNFFGGNGTSTFAVPDLRGEFLRGSGENSRQYQGGGKLVGEHQDSTELPSLGCYEGYSYQNNSPIINPENIPSEQRRFTGKRRAWASNEDNAQSTSPSQFGITYGIRPTNTSVLYCIRYREEETIFGPSYERYSEEEVVVGCWTNGKPIYRRALKTTLPIVETDGVIVSKLIDVLIENTDSIIDLTGTAIFTPSGNTVQIPWTLGGDVKLRINISFNKTESKISINSAAIVYNEMPISVIIEYTKTTDELNSFTPDMITAYDLQSAATTEEVTDILSVL